MAISNNISLKLLTLQQRISFFACIGAMVGAISVPVATGQANPDVVNVAISSAFIPIVGGLALFLLNSWSNPRPIFAGRPADIIQVVLAAWTFLDHGINIFLAFGRPTGAHVTLIIGFVAAMIWLACSLWQLLAPHVNPLDYVRKRRRPTPMSELPAGMPTASTLPAGVLPAEGFPDQLLSERVPRELRASQQRPDSTPDDDAVPLPDSTEALPPPDPSRPRLQPRPNADYPSYSPTDDTPSPEGDQPQSRYARPANE